MIESFWRDPKVGDRVGLIKENCLGEIIGINSLDFKGKYEVKQIGTGVKELVKCFSDNLVWPIREWSEEKQSWVFE